MNDSKSPNTRIETRLHVGLRRSKLLMGVALGIVWLLSSCGPKSPEPKPAGPYTPPTTMEAPMTAVSPPAAPEVPKKWACKVDADCMNSCSQGAVNREWYAMAAVQECEDGCENQLSAPARCLDGGCVAFARDPSDSMKITRSDFCTRREDR